MIRSMRSRETPSLVGERLFSRDASSVAAACRASLSFTRRG